MCGIWRFGIDQHELKDRWGKDVQRVRAWLGHLQGGVIHDAAGLGRSVLQETDCQQQTADGPQENLPHTLSQNRRLDGALMSSPLLNCRPILAYKRRPVNRGNSAQAAARTWLGDSISSCTTSAFHGTS